MTYLCAFWVVYRIVAIANVESIYRVRSFSVSLSLSVSIAHLSFGSFALLFNITSSYGCDARERTSEMREHLNAFPFPVCCVRLSRAIIFANQVCLNKVVSNSNKCASLCQCTRKGERKRERGRVCGCGYLCVWMWIFLCHACEPSEKSLFPYCRAHLSAFITHAACVSYRWWIEHKMHQRQNMLHIVHMRPHANKAKKKTYSGKRTTGEKKKPSNNREIVQHIEDPAARANNTYIIEMFFRPPPKSQSFWIFYWTYLLR